MLIFAAIGLEFLAFASIYADDRLAAISILAIVPIAFVAVKLLGYQRIISKARRSRLLSDLNQQSQKRMAAVLKFKEAIVNVTSADDLTLTLNALAKEAGWSSLRIVHEKAVVFSWPPQRDPNVHLSGLKTLQHPLDLGHHLEIDQMHEDELLGPMDHAFFLIVADAFKPFPKHILSVG